MPLVDTLELLQRLSHGAAELAGSAPKWGLNPLEKLPLWLAVVTLITIWSAGLMRCVGGFQWLGIRWIKPAREELWPILRAGDPPVQWWVLRTFSLLAAFPCLFPRYLGLLWSMKTFGSGPPNMLQLCLLTGAVILAMSAGRIAWLAAVIRTKRYQMILICSTSFCACGMATSSLFIGLVGRSSALSWLAVVITLCAVAASTAARPIENVLADANNEWVEFGTPRTNSQRQTKLRDVPRTYGALGSILQTLLVAGGLQLTARFAGDLSFLCVVGAAALSTAFFYESCVYHTSIEASSATSAHSTPHPTPRLAMREPMSRSQRRGGRYSLAGAHAVHSGLGPLAGPLFAIYAFQVLGLPVWLLGAAHAIALASEAIVLRFEDMISALVKDEGLWFWGSLIAAARLYLFTMVTRGNCLWLLPLIEATYGFSTGLANLAGSRLLERLGCVACASRTSKGTVGTLGDGGLSQAAGCALWGLFWHYIGFRQTYITGCLVGIILAVMSSLVVFCCGKDRAPTPSEGAFPAGVWAGTPRPSSRPESA